MLTNTKLTEEGIVMSNKALVPEAKQGLSRFKNEVAQELGVPFKAVSYTHLQWMFCLKIVT